jgi:hypothetical protein
MRTSLVLAIVLGMIGLAAAGCSSTTDDGAAGESPAGDAGTVESDGAPASGEDGSTTSSGPDAEAGTALPPVRFKIQLDYRYDRAGFFADPTRKQALEGACRIWGRLISDSFANVPKDTFIKVRDPEKPTEPAVALNIEYEIDDLVVFVGSADLPSGVTGTSAPTAGLSGITDTQLASSLDQRFNGAVFQPWTAWITFDTTTSFHFDPSPELGAAVPAGKIDFVSVALHELGHVLGFGTAEAFKSKIVSKTFTGAKAQALFGGPLPLTTDLAHVPNASATGTRRMLMDQSDSAGVRYLPSPLDLAALEDLGLHF